MTTRNRTIYASQSVIVDGNFLYRVQTLGSTSTFNSEDVFELGQLDIIDVVDDVPTVAVTLDSNDWGSVYTAAYLAGLDTLLFDTTASGTGGSGHLTVDSGTGVNYSYYNGVALADFSLETARVNIWAPVQAEASIGTTTANIDQTLVLPDCYVNNLEMNYSSGANATENYGLETDSKMWLLNDGKCVSFEEFRLAVGRTTIELGLPDVNSIPTLSSLKRGFLYKTTTGEPALAIYDATDSSWTNYEIVTGAATTTKAGYVAATHVITLPTAFTAGAGDLVRVLYCSSVYASGAASSPALGSQRTSVQYFVTAANNTEVTGGAPETLGAVRQGQIEIYLVDPDLSPTDYEMSLRMTSARITAALNRERLSELGHLKPYYRPLTYPVEITTALETTAGDLATFAKISGRYDAYDADTMVDISIDDLVTKDNLVLVIMIYEQTNEEAGGSYSSRIIKSTSSLIGKEYYVIGKKHTYAVNNREYPVKTVIVPGLKATEEAYNNAVGQNATQTFSFRSTNKMFMIQGYVHLPHILASPGIERNA
jgi:hypothetical protein